MPEPEVWAVAPQNYPDDYKLGVDKGVFKIFFDILTFS